MELAPLGHYGVRQAGAFEHLSAVVTHLQLFFAALCGATGTRQEETLNRARQERREDVGARKRAAKPIA